MKLFDGWVAGIGNSLVELYGIRGSFKWFYVDEHGLVGKLVLHEGGVDGGVRGDEG